MNDTLYASQPPERPSSISAFFGGFGSGMLNGALMMGVVFGLGALAAFIPAVAAFAPSVLSMGFLGTATFMSVATGIFGGIMGIKRNLTEPMAHEAIPASHFIPVQSQGVTLVPAVGLPDRVDQSPSQHWAERTGRANGTQARLQSILDNGALSDKNRAQAMLTSREAADKSFDTAR